MSVKKIVNHHKLQRKFKNKVNKMKKIFDYFFNRKKTRRDFAWKGREVENPFIHEKTSHKAVYLEISLILVSIFFTFFIFVFNSFFSINNIQIEGLQRIKQDEILETVQGILNYKKLGFIPKNSYLLANIETIKDILKERYPIEKIIIKKSFPNKLEIIIQEKISTIIYDNGLEYCYVDLDGKVVEIMRKISDYEWKNIMGQVVSTTPEGETVTNTIVIDKYHEPDINSIKKDLGNYPILYDKNHTEKININDKVLDKTEVASLISWFRGLDSNEKIPLKYFIFEDNKQDLIIRTYNGFYIKTRFDKDVNAQINKLGSLYKEKIQNEKDFLEYIDLRYPDRIYWK